MNRPFPATAWCAGRQQRTVVARTRLAPISNDANVLSAKEALHRLHMSCAAYHYDRAARGIGIPAEVSVQLLVMSQAIYDGRNHGTVLSNSIDFFSRTPASVENVDMREALRVAKLALKAAMADTQTELPIVTPQFADERWVL